MVVEAQWPTVALTDSEQPMRLALRGLSGGHSGIDIDKGLGNANRLLVRGLRALKPFGARLIDYYGGSLRNALPREAFADLALPSQNIEAAGACTLPTNEWSWRPWRSSGCCCAD